jgi:beta-N-acetylhexosaminidase
VIQRPGGVGLAAAVVALASAGAALALAPASGRSVPVAASTDSALRVRDLSPRQLAGQRVIYSYVGLAPPASLLTQIKKGQAAGVIFYSDNISSKAQIESVIQQLQHAAAQCRVHEPLLMMTDQEGGQVRRLPGAPGRSEKQIGESPDPPAAARHAGRGAGLNLKSVKMNVNLAPVLDVYREPGNFIDQYGRSYSSNPHTVARLGSDFIKSQERAGVAATAKHFPGLGAAATNQDTDSRPVTLSVPKHKLRTIDELPYRSANPAGVKLVMVSWARYPALDKSRPAGLSRTVVQGELRSRLGFKGVTITDALEAGALQRYGSTANRAVLAAGAGMDLLLCASQSVSQGNAAVSALEGALKSGKLRRSAFMSSVHRVMALRSELGP